MELEIYGIYDGKVTNTIASGCFVQLNGFPDKKEGMVHISQIQQGMVKDVNSVVKRNQNVKVKVISMVGTKIALSMKEVNQETGEDLVPSRSKEAYALQQKQSCRSIVRA
jgi:ATP-dependent RNA helicase DHX8/PRP22